MEGIEGATAIAISNQEKPKVFGEKEATETLTQYASGGPERQQPVASYGEGSTIIFNKLAPGTITRETVSYSNSEGPANFWRCVGAYHPDTRTQDMWVALGKDAYGETLPPDGSYVVQNQPIRSDQANGNVEYTVGKRTGNVTDAWLRQASNTDFEELRRKTQHVDIMSLGKRSGGGEKRPVVSGKLSPVTTPAGVTI
jgi:hypothetical protein